MAGKATISGKLNKTVSISTQRSLVTNLYDPRVTSDPCDHMETGLDIKILVNSTLQTFHGCKMTGNGLKCRSKHK